MAADRRPGDVQVVMVARVPGDGLRSGVQALLGQLLADTDDQLDRLRSKRGR